VYQFDSCGNSEGVAEDCNFLAGDVCGQNTNGEFECISTDCPSVDRKNGESWCEFDEFTANNQDVAAMNTPGSRHYRRACVNGKILYEECKDFREEVCMELISDSTGKKFAGCVPTENVENLTGVQRGGPFWDGIDECSKASEYEKWDGDVRTQPWVNQKALSCVSLGDCGNDFNWIGTYTQEGFTATRDCRGEQRNVMGIILNTHLGITQNFERVRNIRVDFVDVANPFSERNLIPFIISHLLPVLAGVVAIYQIVDLIIDIYGSGKTRCRVTCSAWQPPQGGDSCERCTEDPNKPCTEYRCKALGQLCDIVNENTPFAECVNLNPGDVSPPTILPDEDVLSGGYNIITYDNGFEINEPIQPYERVTIGILTEDESGQEEPVTCKVSHEIETPYEQMTNWFATNLYLSKHNTTLTIPAAAISPEVMSQTNGEFTIYIKCQDKSGNANQDDYLIRFKTLPEPDITAPLIELTIPLTNSKIPAALNETPLFVYTNEPADCKYAKIDMLYNEMPFTFEYCESDSLEITSVGGSSIPLYECNTNLTDLKHDENNIFYIRCKDQPLETDETKRNPNTESEQLVLIPSDPLEITLAKPEGEIFIDRVTLRVETASGADVGDARCGYKTDINSPYIEFLQTGSNVHTQNQGPLPTGPYTYYLQCLDSVGNIKETTISFTIAIDTNPPKVISLLPTATQINLVLDEPATCKYSTEEFSYETEGTIAQVNSTTQSIPLAERVFAKCRDIADNELSLRIHP